MYWPLPPLPILSSGVATSVVCGREVHWGRKAPDFRERETRAASRAMPKADVKDLPCKVKPFQSPIYKKHFNYWFHLVSF